MSGFSDNSVPFIFDFADAIPVKPRQKSRARTTKLVTIGGSQHVRIPKDLRFEGREVMIEETTHGVLIRPILQTRDEIRAWLMTIADPDFPDVPAEIPDHDPIALFDGDEA